MTLSRRNFAAASLAAFPLLSRAQAFPSRPIKLVVAGSAGASTAAVARALGAGLESRLGVPVVVDPKPGGNGVVAGVAVTNAPALPDELPPFTPTPNPPPPPPPPFPFPVPPPRR